MDKIMNDKLIQISQSDSIKLLICGIECVVDDVFSLGAGYGATLHCESIDSEDFIVRWNNCSIARNYNIDDRDYDSEYVDYYLRKYNLDPSKFQCNSFTNCKVATLSASNAEFQIKRVTLIDCRCIDDRLTAWIYFSEIN